MDISQLPKGCVPDPADKRDYKIESLGAAPPVDWNMPFSVPEPRDEDQGISDACVAYATSYYHENIKPGRVFSRRDLFARIALNYGSSLRDAILAVVKQGQATRDEAFDPDQPTPQNMRDKTGLTAAAEADDREFDGYVIPAADIDSVARTIRDFGGCLFGVIGDNKGWADILNPAPPTGAVPLDFGNRPDLWGHGLYGKGYHMHDGQKCIIAKSSWCRTGVKEHHIKENYFKSGFTYNPWTLIPRKDTMANPVKKYKVVDTTLSPNKLGVAIVEGFTGNFCFAKDQQSYADFLRDFEVPDDAKTINLV